MNDPASVENLRQLAEASRLHQAGQLDAAEQAYAVLLAATPDDPIALINGGSLALARNDVPTAIERLRRAVQRVPANAVALGNLALALIHAGRDDEALRLVDRALKLQPRNAQLQNTRGMVLVRLHRDAEATTAFRNALQFDPRQLQASLNLGALFNRAGAGDEASALFERALAAAPGNLAARVGHAFAIALNGDLDRSLEALEAIVKEHDDDATAWQTLGAVANWSWRHAEAEAAFRRASALDSRSDEARFGIASTLLARGRYRDGFAAFEARPEGVASSRARLPQWPAWDGNPVAGSLLLYAEQGLGDVVQFARFVPLAASRAHEVILLLDGYWQPLAPLLAGLAGVRAIATKVEDLRNYDIVARASMLSLPHLLDATLDGLPSQPYLHAPADRLDAWKQRLANVPHPRVGLAWSVFARDDHGFVTRHKSVPAQALSDALAVPDIAFVSLQPGPAGDPAAFGPLRSRVLDFRAAIRDFADTAALVAQLDLVASADTAVAHVAGALGVPVLLLDRYNSCWRWRVDPGESPWYPGLRILRQSRFGDWSSVGSALARELRARFGRATT